jgi:exosortase/archaeosortase family protein
MHTVNNTLNIKIKQFIKKHQLESLKDVALFIIITLIIHYAWRFWANQLHYVPINDFMSDAQNWMAGVVFRQSTWFVQHVLGIELSIVQESNSMYFSNESHMYINQSCSGLKQIMQFVILMMVFPGPWKRKLWFIPLGILIVHLTNLFRIIGLSVVLVNVPDYWKFSHDYIFRPFFYVVIFFMWVWWVDKISQRNTAINKKAAG